MGEIRKDNLHESLIEELNDLANIDLSGKQDKTDESLLTESKDLVGAINELFQSANNGKELIANAIGEPVSAEDTFSAMSNDINGLLSTFKTNMMNNGITVESSDRFKSLIDKIATMVEEGEGKGIQYAEGSVPGYSSNTNIYNGYTIEANFGFTPTILFVQLGGLYYSSSYTFSNVIISNLSGLYTTSYGNMLWIDSFDDISFTLKTPMSGNIFASGMVKWYAIGVGEEDTTLRDSLASILTEEGVSVTEEDDMASLISKVDEEFDNKNSLSNKYATRNVGIPDTSKSEAFTYANSTTTVNLNYITIDLTSLDFLPSVIILSGYCNEGAGVECTTTITKLHSQSGLDYYVAKCSRFSYDNQNSAGSFCVKVVDYTRTNSNFKVPVEHYYKCENYTWEAYN